MDGEIRGFRIVTRPRVPLQCQVDTSLLSRCDGDVSIPFQAKQGKRPSSRLEEGKTGLFLTCGWKLNIPLELGRYLRKLLELHKACQVPFRVPRVNVGFLLKHCSVNGPTQACRGEFCGLCGVVAGSLGFLSSCVSTWGTCSCLLREVRSPLDL